MKPWAEENFLERLMPQLRQENRAQVGSCPDARLLSAFTEEQVAPFVREAVTAHLTQCRECSEICARLVSFSGTNVVEDDPDWANADKRLENWADGFLLARAHEKESAVAEPAHVLGRKNVRRVALSWTLWGAVGVAALVVIVMGISLANRPWISPSQVEIAQAPARPAVISRAPAVVEQAGSESGNTAADPSGVQSVPPSKPGSAASSLEVSSLKPDAAKQHVVLPKAPVKTSSTPVNHSGGTKSRALEPRPQPEHNSTTDNTSEEAHSYSPPDLSPNDRILAGESPRATAPSRPASMERAAAGASSASAGAAVTLSVAQLRLEAGNRLWVRLSAPRPPANGNFTFTGNLFQPLAQASASALREGTEVAGSGTVKDGKISIFLSGLTVQGVPYILKTTGGTTHNQVPGAGKALEFEQGHVLEMWLSTSSVYEKAADAGPMNPAKH